MYMAEDNSKNNFPEQELNVLKFWESNKIFKQSVDRSAKNGDYVFYDGPPFATGTPHYGHLVGNILKDAAPRFWTMNGYKVERKWGWDCHGLPIENIVEKEMGSKSKKDIELLGVDKFNELCRSKVLAYAEDWRKTIDRLGRWVDMDEPYKTMDIDYMESVWWVFKQLWDKDLIYESYRSMHICPRCETTLSQSEVAEGYKDIKDLSATAKFKLLAGQKIGDFIVDDNTYILAWTTTPWTLIANVALAVGTEINYVILEKDREFLIVAQALAETILPENAGAKIQVKGTDLLGLKYQPLFVYYSKDETLVNHERGWQVYSADFVTTEDGTGVVHIAPAFGEDDMNLGKAEKLPFVQHIGMDGIIKQECEGFAGLSVKPLQDHMTTDVEIVKYLAGKNLLFSKAKYEHSYPHCWRCDTPLLYYATSSWFVKVTKIKDKALANAKDISWSPEHIKDGRFGQWLSGARDWSISRQRFWASCLPIWKCDCGELEVFGAVVDLEQRSGQKITDLHKHVLDKINITCTKCSGVMKRVPDVIDTWFDSGSMPYAQRHYPFSDQEKFEANFPAGFIAEGVDQTRAWFYYLHILATAIMDKPAFKQAIVNGIVLAADGKKMSKKLANYPDPGLIMDKYGADALRLYLLSSPVMQTENLNFIESGVLESLRKNIMLLWNVYNFYAGSSDETIAGEPETPLSENILDIWVLALWRKNLKEVTEQMFAYNMPKAVRPLTEFIDELSTWYVRRSRDRLHDSFEARATLRFVLVELSKALAPFAPFISETVWQKSMGYNFSDTSKSVHLCAWPVASDIKADAEVLSTMVVARRVAELGLAQRDGAKLKIRQPLSRLTVKNCELSENYQEILRAELNLKEIICEAGEGQIDVVLDTTLTEELLAEGAAREFIRGINGLRKNTGLTVLDRVNVYYQSNNERLTGFLEQQVTIIKQSTGTEKLSATAKAPENCPVANIKIEGIELWLAIEVL